MITVPALEWHASHACNFTCESCSHFSNHNINENVSLKTLEKWYSLWNKRIVPLKMAVLGGEPLLNKEILDIIYMTREMWSKENQYFELVTNGFLLHKYPELPKVLEDTNCVLSVSIHGTSEKYNNKFEKIDQLILDWKQKYNFKVNPYYMSNSWVQVYKNYGDYLEPFEDNNFQRSWDYCPTGQQCFQLLDGKIYKCSMLAYLPKVKEKYSLSSKWDKYLSYLPLDSNCSDNEILEFFNRKAEQYCSMCPAYPVTFEKNDPLLPNSYYKNKKYEVIPTLNYS